MTEAEIDEMLAEQFRDFMNYAQNMIDFKQQIGLGKYITL